VLNSRRKYVAGDVLGIHKLIRCVDTTGPQWRRKWSWKCVKCGRKSIAVLQNIRRAISCSECGARTADAPKAGGNYPPGEHVGIWEVIGTAGHTNDSHKNRLYRVRCRRCGTESILKLSNFRASAKYCRACRYKVIFAGKLVTYDELSALFGIKKSLLMDRTSRRRMSIEDAVLTPVQIQDPHTKTRRCTVCKIPKPLDQFSRKMGRCKACRKIERLRKRDPHEGLGNAQKG